MLAHVGVVAACAAGLAAYFTLYTSQGVLVTFRAEGFVSAAAYVLLLTVPVAIAFLVPSRPSKALFGWFLVLLAFIVAAMAASSRYELFLLAPSVSLRIAGLAAPYVVIGLAAVLSLRSAARSFHTAYSTLWAAGLLGLAAFAVFVLSVRGVVASAVLVGAAVVSLLVVGIAGGLKDDVKLGAAFTKLNEEDPSLTIVHDAETHEVVIWGQGEMHLRVAAERLASAIDLAAAPRGRTVLPTEET